MWACTCTSAAMTLCLSERVTSACTIKLYISYLYITCYINMYLILLPHSNSVGIFLIQYQKNHLHSLNMKINYKVSALSFCTFPFMHLSLICPDDVCSFHPHMMGLPTVVCLNFELLSWSTWSKSNTSPQLSKECTIIINMQGHKLYKTLRSAIRAVLEL